MDKQNATQCQGGCGQPLPQRADAPAQRRHAGRRKGLGGRHSNRGEIGNAAHFSNIWFGLVSEKWGAPVVGRLETEKKSDNRRQFPAILYGGMREVGGV